MYPLELGLTVNIRDLENSDLSELEVKKKRQKVKVRKRKMRKVWRVYKVVKDLFLDHQSTVPRV